MKLGDLARDAATAEPALDESDLLHDELDLEEPNSLLELLVDAFSGDWFEVEKEEELPAEEEPAPGAAPAPEVRAPGAAEVPARGAAEAPASGAPPAPAAPPTAPAPAAEPKPPTLEAPAADIASEAQPEAGPPAAPDAGGTVPSRPDEVRDRVHSAVDALSHPHAPNPELSRAKLDQARAASQARGEVRTTFVRTTPSQIAGPAPTHHEPPAPDPGVIPDQIKALRDTFGAKLPPSTLPPLTPSPRGTLPDITRPVLSEFEIGAIAIGDRAIDAMVSGTDQHSVDARARLKRLAKDLGPATATAPAPASPTVGPPPLVPGVQVVDEPIQGLVLSPAQRAIFAQVVGQLRGDTIAEAQHILDALRRAYPKYPGGVIQNLYEKGTVAIGQEQLLPNIAGSLTGATNALANSIQLAPDEIDAAITARRDEVERLKQQALEAQLQACVVAQQTAVNADARVRATAKATADATARAVATDRALAKPLSPIQARVERTLADLREPVATELARLDTQLRLRERAIADAVREQVSAIGVAQLRDELALRPKRGELETLQSRTQLGEVDRWALKQIAALRDGPDSAQATLTALAPRGDRAPQGHRAGRRRDGACGAARVGRQARQDHRRVVVDDGRRPAALGDAGDRAGGAVARPAGEASRLALAQDLESFQRIVAIQQAGDREAANQYMARLDGEARSVVVTLLDSLNKGAPDLAGALTAGIRERVRAAEREAVELELDQEVDALQPKGIDDPAYLALEAIAEAIQPDFNLTERAGKIHTAVTRYRGFDEEAIFEALSGLSPPAAKVLPVYYASRWQNFEEALRGKTHVGHLSEDELRSAHELLRGDRVEGAVGAIHSAIERPRRGDRRSRPHPARPHARRARPRARALPHSLRGLAASPTCATSGRCRAPKSTRRWRSSATTSSARTRSPSGARSRPGRPVGTSSGAAARCTRSSTATRRRACIAQVRKEVEARGRALPLAQRADRGGDHAAQPRAGEALRRPGRGPVVGHGPGAWSRDAGRVRPRERAGPRPARGLGRRRHRSKADVARLRLEDQGIYAEDAAINAVFREQNARSLAEVRARPRPIPATRVSRPSCATRTPRSRRGEERRQPPHGARARERGGARRGGRRARRGSG